MQKKIFFSLFVTIGLLGISSCSNQFSWWGNSEDGVIEKSVLGSRESSVPYDDFSMLSPNEAASVYNKRIPQLNSLIVCRDKQCAPADISMTRDYVYNALAQLIDNNLDEKALLCEANSQAHVCINPYISVPARIGVTPAYVFFDGVKIVDATIVKGETSINIALGYSLSYNGQTPTICKPDKSMLYVKGNNEIVLNGNGFQCNLTSVGTTTIRVMFTIDYVDLDYGYIGGYYSIGLAGPAVGGGSGYGLIRLVKDAHPLNPVLKAKIPAAHTGALNFSPSISETPQVLTPQNEVAEKTSADTDSSVKETPVVQEKSGSDDGIVQSQVIENVSDEISANTMNKEDVSSQEQLNVDQPVAIFPSSKRVKGMSNQSQKNIEYEVKSSDNEPSSMQEIYIEDLEDDIK